MIATCREEHKQILMYINDEPSECIVEVVEFLKSYYILTFEKLSDVARSL